ncbi:CBS domain-containing protein [Modicisalibacter xianhensis]|uniref:CBS domain-containing protein n=1 Tax=Modicisalibacter xianhensis TaxID=442341 RepID=A0A4R8FWH1_9GAMM|nr:DUF294 nucleotidyltransferase-like domain-containing protein [Halomonas xianhensis]TDX28421.1 CBS domain-containing protein [Halomonas xianhensis]
MSVELQEVREHMGRHAPFDTLSDELLDEVASNIEVAYFKAGTDIHHYGQTISELCYIRQGAVDVYRRNGELYSRRGEGEIFGQFSLLRDNLVRFPSQAIEDTLLYYIPAEVFRRLCEEDDNFADFVELERPRLEATVDKYRRNNDMMITRVRKLVTRRPVMIEASASVQQAAQRMREENVTSALIYEASTSVDESQARYTFTDSQGRAWTLIGILTDVDFRNRVLAAGLAGDLPVIDIVSRPPRTIQSDESIHEAMLCMLRNNIHHLPVLHRRYPVGVLHLSDIVRYETNSSLYLVNNIFSQPSAKGLAQLSTDVRAAFVRMVSDGADSRMIGSALSTIGRSFTRRLLELAEEELGPPPVPYCFMALGSMARNEQVIVSDQDNALVLDDRFDAERHDDYFAALAQRVSDGLAACGYAYCKGNIMATNPRWRQPLSVWKRYFSDWIARPDPQALLDSSIFFDLDAVHGEETFVEQLQDLVAEQASQSPRFLAAMARNALNRKPPLGFFRGFVMENTGEHKNSINLKRRGTAPMVDLIRVHALACRSRAQNSFARLDDIAQTQLLPEGSGERIRYALEFISMVRIRHQALDIEEERDPDNNVEPENVSSEERHNLKDAFLVLSNAQKFLGFRYPMPRSR